jgi:hypothetical protein
MYLIKARVVRLIGQKMEKFTGPQSDKALETRCNAEND